MPEIHRRHFITLMSGATTLWRRRSRREGRHLSSFLDHRAAALSTAV
jgi:hypothetical protein